MANQIIIDIGAVANDGTGDPLRTAFGYVNNNFSNIWATGVASSNVAFDGNRILTTNTNGNLVLAPNGIGKVQANVDIVPNANNTLSLGSLDRRWNTVYTQNIDISGSIDATGNIDLGGDVVIAGNLTVNGTTTTINTANVDIEDKQITLAFGSPNAVVANGSGIHIAGANANITYIADTDAWVLTKNVTVIGNLLPQSSGNFMLGNSQLRWKEIWVGNIYSGNTITTNAIFSNDAYITRGTFSGGPVTGDGAMYVGSPTFTNLGTDVMAQFTGNVVNYAQINLQNYGNSPTASGDYIITADNGNDSTHFLNLGLTGSNWNGTQPNSLGNRLGPNDGYLYVQDGDMVIGTSNVTIETWKFDQTGNLTVPGDIIPAGNNTQSLGSNTTRWANLYLSGNTIYLGDLSLSAGPTGLTSTTGFDLENSTAANLEATGNISATNVVATEWVYGNIGVETQQIQFTDPFEISPEGVNLLLNGGYLVYESNLGSAGGFVPSANDSESIGQSDRQWSTIYGNSIYATEFFGNIAAGNVVGLATVATSGSYADLANVPTIPTATSNLTNDSGFITTGNLEILTSNVATTANISGAYILGNGSQLTGLPDSYTDSDVTTLLASYGSNTISTTGNITGGNLISTNGVYANIDFVAGDRANASATKTRIVSDTDFSYIQTGNGTVGTTGNIVFSPYSDTTQQVVINTGTGNLTATGNISGGNILGNGASMTGVATKTTGTWTVTPGTNNYSFTVPVNGVYQLWVRGNIPNGIITYTATVSVTNSNVPVIGQQFAWNYEGAGNPITFTSIPDQIIGTAGAISNANPSVGTTTNTFVFGINNSTANAENVTVSYGYTTLS